MNSQAELPVDAADAVVMHADPMPGAALAAARQAHGMSVEEVARQLKLSVMQVRAIEADDHARLPSGVFARGFIRSYARLVKLDLGPFRLPAAPVENKPDTRLMQHPPGQPIEPSSNRLVPLLIAAAACLLLSLAYYEFIFNVPVASSSQPAALGEAQSDTVSAQPIVAVGAITVPPTGVASELDVPAPSAPPPLKGVENLVLKKSTEAVDVPDKGLHFVFVAESWVEVRDGDGRVVLSRTNAAGTQRQIMGKPPFSVVVGGASGVQLTYEGKRIELAKHANDDVARLQLE